MNLRVENRKRREFRAILFDLARARNLQNNPVLTAGICRRLERLYSGDEFRHFYSDIFSVLTAIKQSDDKGDIQTLAFNLDSIRKMYDVDRPDAREGRIDISAKLQKLYDHVNLDVARIEYSEAGDQKVAGEEAIAEIKGRIDDMSCKILQMTADQTQVQSMLDDAQGEYISIQHKLDDAQKEYSTIQNKLDNAQEKYSDMQNKLDNVQKEYITILGIFAAIVLAFTGGIAFSSSVLQNMHRVDIYTVVFVLLIIGIVLVNFLFGLLYYIDRIISNTENHPICPLIISNIILILLLGITCLCWWNGWVESRNERIQSQPVSVEQVEDMSTPETSQ